MRENICWNSVTKFIIFVHEIDSCHNFLTIKIIKSIEIPVDLTKVQYLKPDPLEVVIPAIICI